MAFTGKPKKIFKRTETDAPRISKSAKPQGGSSPQLRTGWGNVAKWYHDTVEEKGSYQRDLILPNLLRAMDVKKGERVLDLACGEGFLSRRLNRMGARVVASDISAELIKIAQAAPEAEGVTFAVSPADDLNFLEDKSVDKAVIVLALQNIENVHGTLKEVGRVLTSKGKLFLVLNHPAFRIPKQSSWGFDEENKVQYRRVDRYLSELREKIQMHPGAKPWEYTLSFHRPLQFFIKALRKAGLAVSNLEEWSSAKTSEPGPRAEAENRARKEIPMFLLLEAVRLEK